MLFHVRLIDGSDPSRRGQSRNAHWAYFHEHARHFIARGATQSDDRQTFLSSVVFVDFPDWGAVREFVDNEPNNRNGVYASVEINRWQNGLGRTQFDFPARDDDVYWYVRGYGKPGMDATRNSIVAEQRDYLAPFDAKNLVVRGPVMDDTGKEWQGSAILIQMPTRDGVEKFLADAPYGHAALYDRVVIERYGFGRLGPPPETA